MPKVQKEDMVQFSIRVPKKLKVELFDLAEKEHRSAAAQIALLLEQVMELRRRE